MARNQGSESIQTPRREVRLVERITDCLETPLLDDRSYRVIKLPNKLEALLVHDAETDKASAALDVNVGSFSDETDMPGMAHAVEHLLFMGTKKYPIENAYSEYLAAHSGYSNAYTASTSTNYFFEVAAKKSDDGNEKGTSPLYEALDRFAQFFINPLFLSSTLDRELQAVDSENKKNLQNDLWRARQLDKSLSNPKHPYCKFSTGNLEVLKTNPEARGIDVRQKFVDFYEKHYSANRMKLVVLGSESLDTLEEWVAELFSEIPNKNLQKKRWEDEKPFREEDLLTQCFIKPVMDKRQLELVFPIIDQEYLYDTQPSRYLSHLVGHEGPGSIFSWLKAKGWASGLSAGSDPICPGTSDIFHCEVQLTEDGLSNYKEIVKLFFQYISLLNETPPQEWIVKEQKEITDLSFKFRQKSPASSFTSRISSVMQGPLPREWLLSGHSRIRKFDSDIIQKCLACIRPDNFRMKVLSQNFPGNWDKKEKWYGTEYKYEKIPADFLAEIIQASKISSQKRTSELQMPHANQFIPTKLEVEKKIKDVSLSPRLIRNDDLMRVWYKKDDQFWVPKANIFVSCRSTLINATSVNFATASLYVLIARDALEEYSYDAQLAGLNYDVSCHSSGIEITVSGYNDKLSVLMEKVLLTMKNLEIKQDRFEIAKEGLMRSLKNIDFGQPYSQVNEITNWLKRETSYLSEQILADLPHISSSDVQQFYPQLLRQVHIETLVHGNIYRESALCLSDLIERVLRPRPLPKSQWPIPRSLIFPLGGNFAFHKTLKDLANVNNCLEYSLYVGDIGKRSLKVRVLLFDQMTSEPAFDQLRSKEQLGYIIISGMRATTTTIGYRIIIQSERSPKYLETRVDAFLNSFSKKLENMTESDFENHKRSLLAKRLEKPKNLDQESGRLWCQIDSEYLDFEFAEKDAAEIRLLTKGDMIEFFNYFIHPNSPLRSKLVVYLESQTRKPLSDTETQGNSSNSFDIIPPLVKENGEAMKPLFDDCSVSSNVVESITDVREFKSRLSISAGPRSVRHITEFEELESRL